MNFWTWGGKYIGYKTNDDILYSYKGDPIGKFYGEELFDFDGTYIGEVKNTNRIIVRTSKKNYRRSAICKPCSRCATSSYCDYVGYVMYVGYEDFKI